MRIGFIGVGYWGPNLLRNFSRIKDVEIAYICDLNQTNIDSVSYLAPDAKKTSNYMEILNDKTIDAVVVASPAPTHYEICMNALNAGKHVFVEKPIALEVKHAEEMVKTAESKGLILMVGHLMLYHPAVQHLKNLINSGDLGDIYYLYSQRLNLGKLRKDENVVLSLAPHDISMMLYLKEADPVEVSCIGGDYLRDGVEDVAFIDIRFSDGSLGHIHVSWLDPHKIRKLTIVGSKKMAVFDDMESSEKIRIFDKGVSFAPPSAAYGEEISLRFGDIVIPFLKMQEPLFIECSQFVESIKNKTNPPSDGRNGLIVLKILDACNRSLKAGGKPVPVD